MKTFVQDLSSEEEFFSNSISLGEGFLSSSDLFCNRVPRETLGNL